MFKLACVVLLAVAVAVAGASMDPLEGTELVLTFLVHRHGDRTPIEPSLIYSNDPDTLKELTAPYGYGQLTTAGKRRGYELGKSIKERYNDFMPVYNRSEVYIRSTDSTRTEMTVLSALAAIFPPVEKVFEGINWTPVPYTTVSPKYDFNLAFANCPTVIKNLAALSNAPSESIVSNYSDILKLLSEHTGYDLLAKPGRSYAIYDEFTAQKSLGVPVDEEIEARWSEVEAVAAASIDMVLGNKDNIAIQAGVLLNEFYKAASDIISGADTRKVRIYSAHDFNVFSLVSATKVTNKQGVPKYGSAYALELRKVLETGKFVVVPVYLTSPGEDFISLNIEGCGSVCDYEDFVDITSEYSLDVDSWRSKCGWTSDIVIDDSSFA